MGFSAESDGNLLWVIVWCVVVIFMGYCVTSGGKVDGLLRGVWW